MVLIFIERVKYSVVWLFNLSGKCGDVRVVYLLMWIFWDSCRYWLMYVKFLGGKLW